VGDASIRPASEADIGPAYMILEACKLGPWFELSARQFRNWWWPTYAGSWVAEQDGALVGYSAARGESVEVYVLPQARRRGIGSRLLARAEDAVEGPLLDAASRRDELAAPPFLEAHGYELSFETWVMQVELAGDIPPPAWPDGMTVRTFRVEEAEAVKELLDLAYAEEPDFILRPFADWKSFMLGDPSFEPESWFVVEASDGSLAAAALNWKEGFVKDLIVHPGYRGQGLGKALLHHTFRHFAARGRERVTLKTDSRNTSQAWRLYERIGMRTIRTLDDWQKRR
jgi:ribosomal protein S18 acetylase RimI-like enzyme